MTFNVLLLTIFLNGYLCFSCAQSLDAADHCADPGQTKNGFLQTIQKHHDDLSSKIEPLMCRLEPKQIRDIFKELVMYFERNNGQGHVLDTEISALQPWSTLNLKVWMASPVFAGHYDSFLKVRSYIQEAIRGKNSREKIEFLSNSPLPLSPKIHQEAKIYEDQYRIFLLLADLLKVDCSLLTPTFVFQLAAKTKNTPIALALMHHYADDPGTLKKFFKDALFNRHTRAVMVFLEAYPQLLIRKLISDITPLHSSTMMGDIDTTKALIKEYPQLLKGKDKDGLTALHYACLRGERRIVREFSKAPADFFSKDHDGATALHYACSSGCTELALDILKTRPELRFITDYKGASILHYACNSLKTTLALISRYPDLLSMLDHTDASVLHYACKDGCTQTVSMLIKDHPSLASLQDHDGATAAHYACRYGSTDAALELAKKDPRLFSITDHNSLSPLDWAYWGEHTQMIKDLLDLLRTIKKEQRSSFLPSIK